MKEKLRFPALLLAARTVFDLVGLGRTIGASLEERFFSTIIVASPTVSSVKFPAIGGTEKYHKLAGQ